MTLIREGKKRDFPIILFKYAVLIAIGNSNTERQKVSEFRFVLMDQAFDELAF